MSDFESRVPALTDVGESVSFDSQYTRIPVFSEWPTSFIHEALWARRRGELGRERARADGDTLKSAVNVAMRAAALDTGAIEGLYEVDRGFTISVATQATAWQIQLDERGPDIRDLFEAQLRAYELVLDVATERLPVSEALIRRLHEELTAPQDTYVVTTPLGRQERKLPKGQYKTDPNHVIQPDGTPHAYAPVSETGPEMTRLVEEINSIDFGRAHPVLQAAYAHYALVAIHPFSDGNGRVARALASVFYYRAESVPLLVFAERAREYRQTLASADRGVYDDLLAFFAEAGVEAMSLVAETLHTARSPNPVELAAKLRQAFTVQGGLTHQELDALGAQILERLPQLISSRVAELELPAGVTVQANLGSWHGGTLAERGGWRDVAIGGARQVHVGVYTNVPTQITSETDLRVMVSVAQDTSETVLVQRMDQDDSVAFGLRELHPEPSAAGEQKLRAFLDRVLGALLQDMANKASMVMRRNLP